MKDTLANLLSLQQELREINKLNELAFFIAHQSKVVIDYQRAIVWSSWQNKHIQIKSISGITRLNKTSPYQLSATEFIDKLITYYAQNKEVQTIDSETAVEAVNKIWLEPLSKYVTFYFFRNSHKLYF